MSERETTPQEWAEAFLLISAYPIAMATISEWWFGLPALPFSLAAARLIRSLSMPANPREKTL